MSLVAALLLTCLFATPAAAQATLNVKDIKVGTGKEAVTFSTVTVHYTGWLMNGTKFDSSHDRNQPFRFTIGGRQVIAGWDQGVKGMRVGGRRELIIPPHLGYGRRGAGNSIPPNSVLKFVVDLLAVNP
jgi:FKBP-type peptidyl-prolyl cis-trans isomerase